MSDINTVVFGQKTIEQLDAYNEREDGELTSEQAAEQTKFAVYLNRTDTRNVDKTKSINLKTLRNLIDTAGAADEIPAISQEDFWDKTSQNYTKGMLISPRTFNIHTEALIARTQSSQATYNTETQVATSGLIPAEDFKKLKTFNIENGSKPGSIRNITSRIEANDYYIGNYAFAQGYDSRAMGSYSHAEGNATIANGTAAHAEGQNSTAQGDFSHVSGIGTTANGRAQTVIGAYNKPDTTSLFIIGNGESGGTSFQKNALTVDWDGRVKIQGNQSITDDKHLTTKQYVDNTIEKIIKNDFITNKKIGDTKLVDLFYPIGSIYMSVNSTSPATLFGGNWERLKDTFLLASGDIYPAGQTGGQSQVTLNAAQCVLREHTHEFTQPTVSLTSNKRDAQQIKSTWMRDKETGEAFSDPTEFGKMDWSFNVRRFNGDDHAMVSFNNLSHSDMTTGDSYLPLAAGTGAVRPQKISYSKQIQHSHKITIPSYTHNHTVTMTNGAVKTKAQENATSPVSTMPPYLAVYVWKRVSDPEVNNV